MKKIFLLALSAMVGSVALFAQKVEDWRIHPNDAQYYIKGYFDPTNDYILTDVTSKGISIKDGKSVYRGRYQEDNGDVLFTFDHIVTNCPKEEYKYISYWVFDNETGEWQPDVEIRSANQGMEHRKIMTVMLVLDCSSSLENEFVHDFKYVKEGAITFLRTMYTASQTGGNIRIGIIAFNSLKKTLVREIEPLTDMTYGRMVNFINSFDVSTGTALYYSLDKAIDMATAYTNTLKSTDEYATPIIVTFTDGLDQTSLDRSKNLKTADAYNLYVNEKIRNADVEHFVVPFKGSDIQTDSQKDKFERILKGLTMPSDDSHYLPVSEMNQLSAIFGQIASDLVDRWQVLQCYVAPARQGQVCWTFGKKKYKAPKPVPVPKPQGGRNIFLGLNGSIGLPMGSGGYWKPTTKEYYDSYGYHSEYNYYGSYVSYFAMGLNLDLGLDFAYPVTDRFAIGFYTKLGSGFGVVGDEVGGSFDFKFGLLMLAGNVNERPFIIGLSPCIGFGTVAFEEVYLPFELRFGRVLPKHFYITGNMNFGIPLSDCFIAEPSITLGYHFGDKIKSKR